MHALPIDASDHACAHMHNQGKHIEAHRNQGPVNQTGKLADIPTCQQAIAHVFSIAQAQAYATTRTNP
jgi:hypothetical protein